MKRTATAVLVLMSLAAGAVRGEDLVFFRGTQAGSAAWVWNDARVKERDGLLVVTEHNKQGHWGDAYLADRLPFFRDGVVMLDVAEVPIGGYTLQVLGFSGDTHTDTADVATESSDVGEKGYLMRSAGFSDSVNSMIFKIWVAGDEGANTKIKELLYYLPEAERHIVMDEKFRDTSKLTADKLILTPGADGVGLSLAPGAAYGAVVYNGRIDKTASDILMMELEGVESGTVTLQLAVFDQDGNYISSVDAVRGVPSGFHAIGMNQIDWPERADSFDCKIWLGGQPNAKATLKRLTVLKP